MLTVLSDVKVLQDLITLPEDENPAFVILSTIDCMIRNAAKLNCTQKLKEAVNKREITDKQLEDFINALTKEHYQPGYLFAYEYVIFIYLVALKDRYMAADDFAQRFVHDLANISNNGFYYSSKFAQRYVTEFFEK